MTTNDLTQKQAELRSAYISEVKYKLNLELDRDLTQYNGNTSITFNYVDGKINELIIDFISETVKKIILNGKSINDFKKDEFWLYINTNLLITGQNLLEIEYTNNYDNTGSGFHRFIDPEDNEVYIHTDFEPYDAHRLFPCFDQPDLKATYQLNITGPKDWEFIHNSDQIF